MLNTYLVGYDAGKQKVVPIEVVTILNERSIQLVKITKEAKEKLRYLDVKTT